MKYINNHHIDLSDSDKCNIFAFSDIHGDLDALISCLRDCAKVISTPLDWRDKAEKTEINDCLNNFTPDGKRVGSFPISYEFDCWGCEWIGKNSIVIITGDLIDNWRNSVSDETNINKRQHEMDYEEIKIMIFLKKMSMKAQKKGGNIINVLGNHDLAGIAGSSAYHEYISKYALEKKIAYRHNNINRIDFFRHNHDLFDNYFIDENNNIISHGKCIILRIQHFLFMHAGLISDLSHLKGTHTKNTNESDYVRIININFNDEFMEFLNDLQGGHYLHERNRIIQEYLDKYLEKYPILAQRKYGKIQNNYSDMCNDYDKELELLCPKSEICKDTYLVIGHCVQSEDFALNYLLGLEPKDPTKVSISTYSNTREINNKSFQINGNIENLNYNKYISKLQTDKPIMSGITSACTLISNKKLAKIYRIDVGVSRSFDMANFYVHLKKHLKIESESDNNAKLQSIKRLLYTLYLARAPQVLKIEYEQKNLNNVKIVRSSLRNMFKTLPRNNHEYIVSDQNGMITHAKMITDRNDRDIIELINRAINEIDTIPPEHILQTGAAYNDYQYLKQKYLKLKELFK